ncbi:hypothetical protein BN130_618 [Cronobacter malonaticus 507]|nr:hypothetical protein BN130_618 [Cronobacter malonaticus 507]
MIEAFRHALNADVQRFQQPHCDFAEITGRRLERFAAAVAEHGFPVDVKFVALGVTAKIVMVIEQQNALLLSAQLLPETGGGKAADARADNHQIILLLHRNAGRVEPLIFTPQRVRLLERAGMVTAKARQRRRIIERLRCRLRRGAQNLPRRHSGGHGDGDAIEKITSGDCHRTSLKDKNYCFQFVI